MRLGMIVRSDVSGLGNQTAEIHRHLKPDVTVNVNFSRLTDALPQGYWSYPGAIETTWKGVGFPFDNPRALLDLKTCDVVFSVETFYDLRLPNEAKAAVLYVNPELFRGYGSPTYWAPTNWLINQLPAGTKVVPMPVATDRPYRMGEGLLHVAGRNASFDRNGTLPAAQAVKRIGKRLKMVHQVDMPPIKGVERLGTMDHYWDLYSHGDTLVMPRRYGGNCLPIAEALAAGLAVIMTDVSPNERWPVMRVKSKPAMVRTVAKFPIPAVDVDVEALIEALKTADEYRHDTESLRKEWVAANSWPVLIPVWRQALEDAAG